MTEEVRYRFITDGDSHWFLIPVGLTDLFEELLAKGEDDYYAEFCNRFEEYSCDYPDNFTFTDPQ